MTELPASDSLENKRRHPRFPLRALAELQYSTKSWDAHVLDISESGARLVILSEHLLQKGDPLRIHIQLDDLNLVASSKTLLNLHGRLIHVREQHLGFEFQPDTPADRTLLYELLTLIENDH
ncbi:PilZ domain-containing protein [Cellvibrio mixtus]|uniref:PilZ domain-containing protein n=1 Tax=Cellvibrio mixtus TaxID=39650 RepID=UPI000587865B|nr:PilZ domain-containing protein [Cellvibrio mixtus]